MFKDGRKCENKEEDQSRSGDIPGGVSSIYISVTTRIEAQFGLGCRRACQEKFTQRVFDTS